MKMAENLKRRQFEYKNRGYRFTDPKNININEKDEIMEMSRLKRLIYPYRILLALSILACILQIYIGFSFFNIQTEETILSQESASPTEQCVLSSDALSAVKRSTTKQCKNEIVQLVCKINAGKLYPTSLPSYCPVTRDEESAGVRVGCFKDTISNRLLKGRLKQMKDDNTPEKCIKYCQQTGLAYAGLEYGVECFCGNEVPVQSSIPDKMCDMPCPGNRNSTCGGYLALDLYRTGLQTLVPSKLGSSEASTSRVKVVFLLSLSGRAVGQVLRLIRRLDGPGSYFYVHVDARQDYMHRELSRLVGSKENVRLASRRFITIWGGASLLSMLLSSFEELLSMSDWNWDFVLNLSESDYPIKSRDALFQFLSSNANNNFIKSHGRETSQFIAKQGLDRTFYQCENRMWRLGQRVLPTGIQMDGGSDWVSLNREFANYVVTSEDDLVTGLKVVFNHTLLAAESFFHTVLVNSKFCRTYINNNLHLTNWKRKQGCKCQYKAVVDWCGCSPNDFLSSDWPRIEATHTRQLFFARKFEPIIHNQILDRIDVWLNLSLPESELSAHYWQNVYHHLDRRPSQSDEFFTLINFLAVQFLQEKTTLANFTLAQLLEVNLYKHKDQLDNFLVLFQAINQVSKAIFTLELKVSFTGEFEQKSGRLVQLHVGTQFDPKEVLFRNFLRNFGQSSNISARCQFETGTDNQTFRVGWFDPRGELVAVNLVRINDTAYTSHVVPINLEKPLLPGIWSVVATSGNSSTARQHKFVVLPAGQALQEPAISTPLHDSLLENTFQQLRVDRVDQQRQVENDLSLLREGRMDVWSRRHIPQFYQVKDVCVFHQEYDTVGLEIPSCSHTSWTSNKSGLVP